MSNKYTVLFTSLFLILSAQSNIVRADYSPPFIDDDIEAAESTKAMRPLLDLDQKKMPLSTFQSRSPIRDYTVMTQNALDMQKIPVFNEPSFVSKELNDEITKYEFGERVQFSNDEQRATSEIRDTLKKESWKETLAKELEKMGPYFPTYYNSFEIPD